MADECKTQLMLQKKSILEKIPPEAENIEDKRYTDYWKGYYEGKKDGFNECRTVVVKIISE